MEQELHQLRLFNQSKATAVKEIVNGADDLKVLTEQKKRKLVDDLMRQDSKLVPLAKALKKEEYLKAVLNTLDPNDPKRKVLSRALKNLQIENQNKLNALNIDPEVKSYFEQFSKERANEADVDNQLTSQEQLEQLIYTEQNLINELNLMAPTDPGYSLKLQHLQDTQNELNQHPLYANLSPQRRQEIFELQRDGFIEKQIANRGS